MLTRVYLEAERNCCLHGTRAVPQPRGQRLQQRHQQSARDASGGHLQLWNFDVGGADWRAPPRRQQKSAASQVFFFVRSWYERSLQCSTYTLQAHFRSER